MTKLMGVAALVALLALPSVALGANGHGKRVGDAKRAARQQCNQERKQTGKPAFQQKYGLEAFPSTPDEYSKLIASDLASWKAVVKAANIPTE